ncbi:MAG TPA: YdeI/OmpD-associated family protein [Croceibacterium sp.]|nr:YdeI/OmpD-associated family protein [Croceibacterium sp.]
MTRDPRIDDKIANAAPFARPILEHLRELVHRAVPAAEEAIKWGMPHFIYKGKNIAGMASFKAHCAFMIHGEGRQGAEGGGMGSAGKIATLADLPSNDDLAERLRAAQARIDRGETERRRQQPARPKAAIEVPQDLAAGLAANPAAARFWDGLAPSHRHEYLQWITEAKRDETRVKRLGQALEWLAEGKRRNWKYER